MRAVYATDLSEAIETAINSQICLECLERYGITDVDLITVTSPNVSSGLPGSDFGGRPMDALESQADRLREEGFTVETHVVRGTPHRRINGLAERVNADLIIVGSRGRSPLEQRFIGGTARNVARSTVRPLLVQRILDADADHEVANEHLFENVLYATDFSENAERAFDQFDYLTTATREATLLHVAPPDRRAGAEGVDDPGAKLDELASELAEKGIPAEAMVRKGEAVDEILAAASEVNPTTILMGSRGQSHIRRLLLGSTSEAVTARADSNVLLVPPSRVR